MKLFGKSIDPCCYYCKLGKKTSDQQMILCARCGVVSPSYSCKHFQYAPLKRTPKKNLILPTYKKEDFLL